MDSKETSSRVAIITGGTGALGTAVAKRFLEAGGRVAIPVRPTNHLPEIPPAFSPWKQAVSVAAADLAVETAVRQFVAETINRFGRIDVLVNTAGAFAGGAVIGEATAATLDDMLTTNLKTAFLMCSAILPPMRERKFGRIVSIAAMPALFPTAGRGPYAIAKGGIVTLTETIAEDVKGTGITANAIAPSIIRTPANQASMPKADASRWVSAEELADLVFFLCSESARSLNGNVIKAFGGV